MAHVGVVHRIARHHGVQRSAAWVDAGANGARQRFIGVRRAQRASVPDLRSADFSRLVEQGSSDGWHDGLALANTHTAATVASGADQLRACGGDVTLNLTAQDAA
jgi:hypothetical protein